jgi:hypothetical protein
MKKISIIKDAIRNMPHVIIVNEDESFESFPITEFGKTIEKEAISNGVVNTKRLPDGFASTSFKQITPQIEAVLGDRFATNIDKKIHQETASVLEKTLDRKFLLREKSLPKVRIFGIADRKISAFKNAKNRDALIDYKARRFASGAVKSSILSSIKSGRMQFDSKKNVLVSRKSNAFSSIAVDAANEKAGYGQIRRMLMKSDSSLTQDIARRTARRAKTLSSIEKAETKISGTNRIFVSSKARLG